MILICLSVACASGAIRLVGGTDQYEGRLEICVSNVWGTVCDNMWDTTDASVACKQLGYSEHSQLAIFGAVGWVELVGGVGGCGFCGEGNGMRLWQYYFP